MQVFKGRDGHVRSVKVLTPDGEYERPVVKCCLLIPTESYEEPRQRSPEQELDVGDGAGPRQEGAVFERVLGTLPEEEASC